MRGARCSEPRSRSAPSSRSCWPFPCCPPATPESCWRPTATSVRRSAGRSSPARWPWSHGVRTAVRSSSRRTTARPGRSIGSARSWDCHAPTAVTTGSRPGGLHRTNPARSWSSVSVPPRLARSFTGCRLVLRVDNSAGMNNDERGAPDLSVQGNASSLVADLGRPAPPRLGLVERQLAVAASRRSTDSARTAAGLEGSGGKPAVAGFPFTLRGRMGLRSRRGRALRLRPPACAALRRRTRRRTARPAASTCARPAS